MRLKHLTPVALVLIAPQSLGGTIPDNPKPINGTVCSIKNAAKRAQLPRPRLISLTAHPVFELHYGYHLVDPRCSDQIDGTGMMRIEFPKGKKISDFPELNTAFEQSFLSANAGKKIYGTCVGLVSYPKRRERFVLAKDCRVWAEG